MRRKSGRHESRSIVPLTAEGVLLISNRGTGPDQSQSTGCHDNGGRSINKMAVPGSLTLKCSLELRIQGGDLVPAQ